MKIKYNVHHILMTYLRDQIQQDLIKLNKTSNDIQIQTKIIFKNKNKRCKNN